MNMTVMRRNGVGFFMAVVLITAGSASGAVTTIQVTGVFDAATTGTSTSTALDGLLNQPFTLNYIYDSSVADSASDTDLGSFLIPAPAGKMELVSGGVTISADNRYSIFFDGPPELAVVSTGDGVADKTASGLTLPVDTADLIVALFQNLPSSAFDFLDAEPDVLPDIAPNLGSIEPGDAVQIYIAHKVSGSYVDLILSSTLTSIQPIPEPSSLALLGLGGLLITRRRFRPGTPTLRGKAVFWR